MSDYNTPDKTLEEYEARRKRRRKKRLQKRIGALLVLLLLVLFLIILLFSGGAKKTASIEIPAGSSAKQIGSILKEEGVIPSKSIFYLKVLSSPYRTKLKYGTFTIEKGMSYEEILELLATQGAKRNSVTVTIPEGFSVQNIITRLTEAGISDRASLEQALKKEYEFSFLKHIPEHEDCHYRLQGFLFPSTYEFFLDATAEDVIRTMLGEFEKQYQKIGIPEEALYETVILASLVEREARLDSERATIAGVIQNRLKKSQKLQIDATVVYAVTDGSYDLDRVLYRHLETDSPYNTYKYQGLPVGPICNPGAKSLAAAQKPQKHDYLYYHTDTDKNDGSHIFTETFSEHKETKSHN